jgi:hypothetical protein
VAVHHGQSLRCNGPNRDIPGTSFGRLHCSSGCLGTKVGGPRPAYKRNPRPSVALSSNRP